jgi:hypothetical protein
VKLAFLTGCGIAINIVLSPYLEEFCQSLNAAYSAPDLPTMLDVQRLSQDVKWKGASY